MVTLITTMWRDISVYFDQFPKRKKVAQKMLELGLRVHNHNVYCGSIELSDSKIARALSLDRRAVKATIETINNEPKLVKIFSKLKPTCHLRDMAGEMGWDVIEIIPKNASEPGILAKVATIIAEEGISIRQAIVDDFEMNEEPHLFVVIEKRIPPQIIPKIKNISSVKSVIFS